MGEGASRPAIGGAIIPGSGSGAGSGAWRAMRSSTSGLPGLEVDARIDPGLGEVGDQVHQQPDHGENEKVTKHTGVELFRDAPDPDRPERERPKYVRSKGA